MTEYHSGDYSVIVPYKMVLALLQANKINPACVDQVNTIITFETPEMEDNIELPIACFPKTIKARWPYDNIAYFGSASTDE